MKSDIRCTLLELKREKEKKNAFSKSQPSESFRVFAFKIDKNKKKS